MDLYEENDGWQSRVAYVRPYRGGFRVVTSGTDKQVPVFVKYETREEAMEAAVGFVKLLAG